ESCGDVSVGEYDLAGKDPTKRSGRNDRVDRVAAVLTRRVGDPYTAHHRVDVDPLLDVHRYFRRTLWSRRRLGFGKPMGPGEARHQQTQSNSFCHLPAAPCALT